MAAWCSVTFLRVCFLWWILFFSVVQGVLSATPLIFIIPSACFLKLSPGRWFQGENLIPSILILTGVFVMITGLTMTGLYPQDCSHGVEMFYCADANVSGTVPPVWLERSASFYTIFTTDTIQQNCDQCKTFYASNIVLFLFDWIYYSRWGTSSSFYASSMTGGVFYCSLIFTWVFPRYCSFTETVNVSDTF